MYRVSPRACFRRETKTDPFLSVIVILLLFLANADKSPENGRPSSQRAPVPSKWAHGTTPLHKITLLSVQNPQCTSVLFKEFISKMGVFGNMLNSVQFIYMFSAFNRH